MYIPAADGFHNPHMLSGRCSGGRKEDNIAGLRGIGIFCLFLDMERIASGKRRVAAAGRHAGIVNHTFRNSRLSCTPADKHRAPCIPEIAVAAYARAEPIRIFRIICGAGCVSAAELASAVPLVIADLGCGYKHEIRFGIAGKCDARKP